MLQSSDRCHDHVEKSTGKKQVAPPEPNINAAQGDKENHIHLPICAPLKSLLMWLNLNSVNCAL